MLFYTILKYYSRFALWIVCRHIGINKPAWLSSAGPLLLACNHPNSFLDAIILTTLFEQPVYSLARGDAFRNPRHRWLLQRLQLLPVYRTSEGTENLHHNYATFEACINIFRQGGIVIIFSEGGTKNEWQLRPLRKGTARLAIAVQEAGINLTVLPVGINYNAFRNFGKNVFIEFGKPLNMTDVMAQASAGKKLLAFNKHLKEQLKELVFDIKPSDTISLKNMVGWHLPKWRCILLALPAAVGFLLHAPLYFSAKAINSHYFDNDHFDSTLFSILALTYPFYWVLIVVTCGYSFTWYEALAMVPLLPVTAWSCIQIKRQF